MKRSIFSLLLALSVLTLSLIASPTRAEWVGVRTTIDPSGQPFNDGGGGTLNTDTSFTAFQHLSFSSSGQPRSISTGAGNQWNRFYQWNGGGDPMTGIGIPVDLSVQGSAAGNSAYVSASGSANTLGGGCGTYAPSFSFSKTAREDVHLQVVGTEAYITITVAARGGAGTYSPSPGSASGDSEAHADVGF